MRNITQYFEDNVQSNNDISIHSDNDTRKETKYRKDSKGKRNRVKIKISRTNSNEGVCDIMDNSSGMIDKTPSPFAKINNEDKHSYETRKKSFPKSVRKPSKRNKPTDQASSYLNLGTNDFDIKNREQSKEGNVKTRSSSNKKYRKELSNKTNISEDVSIDSTLKSREVIDDIEVVTIDSNNEIENSREESNAFQILMNRNKVVQYASPIKVLPQNEEVNSRKSEEYREKLKRSKEKLIALADKKGYSKRKLAEMEEGEKIEQIIQNRIKLFKGEEKKDSNMSTTILNHKQSGGSLLNYFR